MRKSSPPDRDTLDELPKADQRYRLSTASLVAYVTLWATLFGLVRVLIDYSSLGATGSYPISAAYVTDFVLPLTLGLALVTIGLTVAYVAGQMRNAWVIVVWCFLVGLLALPALWLTIVVLAILGILPADF